VTLYLPSHTTGVLRDVTLDGASYFRPCEYDCRLLLIGDSITQGWESEYDSMTYAYALSRALRANSINQGVGGSCFDEKTQDDLPFDPDIVTVAYGTNDYDMRASLDEMRVKLIAFLDTVTARYAGKRIFLISPIWRDRRDAKMGRFEDCRAIIFEEATRRGMIHIDGLKMVPPIPSLYSDEYLHPNALGFAYYAENVVSEVKKALQKA
jgi:lysophospholipase L1-like esterase